MEVYYKENERIKISSLKDQYLEQYPERTRYTTTTSFNKYLHEYAKYKGILSPYLAQQRDGSLGGKIIGTVSNPKFEKGSVKRF